jgi:hypothetical protein
VISFDYMDSGARTGPSDLAATLMDVGRRYPKKGVFEMSTGARYFILILILIVFSALAQAFVETL